MSYFPQLNEAGSNYPTGAAICFIPRGGHAEFHQKDMLASTFLFFDGFQTAVLIVRSHATVL
jgi:hypothetical protein